MSGGAPPGAGGDGGGRPQHGGGGGGESAGHRWSRVQRGKGASRAAAAAAAAAAATASGGLRGTEYDTELVGGDGASAERRRACHPSHQHQRRRRARGAEAHHGGAPTPNDVATAHRHAPQPPLPSNNSAAASAELYALRAAVAKSRLECERLQTELDRSESQIQTLQHRVRELARKPCEACGVAPDAATPPPPPPPPSSTSGAPTATTTLPRPAASLDWADEMEGVAPKLRMRRLPHATTSRPRDAPLPPSAPTAAAASPPQRTPPPPPSSSSSSSTPATVASSAPTARTADGWLYAAPRNATAADIATALSASVPLQPIEFAVGKWNDSRLSEKEIWRCLNQLRAQVPRTQHDAPPLPHTVADAAHTSQLWEYAAAVLQRVCRLNVLMILRDCHKLGDKDMQQARFNVAYWVDAMAQARERLVDESGPAALGHALIILDGYPVRQRPVLGGHPVQELPRGS